MQRIRRLGFLCVSVVVLVAASIIGLYRASQSVPEFYELALELENDVADQAGDELERQVVEMASDVDAGQRWELVLTDQQVNGWLASDLIQKFPKLLPREVREPRVAFQNQTARVACRVESGKVSAVLSLSLEAYLTDQPNEIAVRVRHVRAGALPVPLTRILDQVTAAAHQSGLSLRWTQKEGDPVALIALPTDRPELRSGVVLERLEVGNGEVIVSGTVDEFSKRDETSSDDQPRFAESIDEDSTDQR